MPFTPLLLYTLPPPHHIAHCIPSPALLSLPCSHPGSLSFAKHAILSHMVLYLEDLSDCLLTFQETCMGPSKGGSCLCLKPSSISPFPIKASLSLVYTPLTLFTPGLYH